MKNLNLAKTLPILIAFGTAVGLATPTMAQSRVPAAQKASAALKHPHYIHALANLRLAYAMLNQTGNKNYLPNQRAAMHEIGDAMNDIKQAARAAGLNAEQQVAVDVKTSHLDQPNKVVALLQAARTDLTQYEEQSPGAREARQHAITNINEGLEFATEMAQKHPHYLHALADLREAYALLNKSDRNRMDANEKGAMNEIGNAMNEIKQASSESGMNVAQQETIDVNVSRLNRRAKIIALLQAARTDITKYDEQNQDAKGWRQRAITDIDQGLQLINKSAEK